MQTPETGLPVKRKLTIETILSIIIALIMAGTSITSLIYRTQVYPPEHQSLYLQDWFNLAVNLPLLLIIMFLAWRGKLIGLLLWPGQLLMITYAYLANFLNLPFNVLYLPNLFIITLSVYTLIAVVAAIDGEVVRQRFEGRVREKFGAIVLLALAVFNTFRQVTMIVMAILDNGEMDVTWTTDILLYIPVMLACGIQLWRKKTLGYVGSVGMLFAYGVLAISAIPFVTIEPVSNGSPVDWGAVIVLAVMTVICFVPMFFFIRPRRDAG
ncbi:MAG: hypothetical protein JXJ17_17410 [Anaerolineae bacterium]|nr:hypothetical protein [Anaerolineae bacterium]